VDSTMQGENDTPVSQICTGQRRDVILKKLRTNATEATHMCAQRPSK